MNVRMSYTSQCVSGLCVASRQSPDVDILDLARRSKNFSGAEIEGLVKSAVSFALARQARAQQSSQVCSLPLFTRAINVLTSAAPVFVSAGGPE